MDSSIGVLVLAGGKSERMGYPKPYLLYEGKTFLQNIVDSYIDAGVKNICIVINKNFCSNQWKKYLDLINLNVKKIKNPNPEFGRFHSIKLGMENFSAVQFCFIHNVDNPFINKRIIQNLLENKNLSGYTSPVYNGNSGHPILISNKIIQRINKTSDKDINLRTVLNQFPRNEIEVNSDDILININTAHDFENHIVKRKSFEKCI